MLPAQPYLGAQFPALRVATFCALGHVCHIQPQEKPSVGCDSLELAAVVVPSSGHRLQWWLHMQAGGIPLPNRSW